VTSWEEKVYSQLLLQKQIASSSEEWLWGGKLLLTASFSFRSTHTFMTTPQGSMHTHVQLHTPT
jgi:hypothetical protein